MIAMVGVPEIETERLLMRAPQAADAGPWIDFMTSDRARYVGGPLTRRLAWRIFAAQIGHWAMLGFGNWSVLDRADGLFLGLVGCWRPEPWPENELGWTLVAGAEGKGYAFEAAVAARACAYRRFGWTTAVSYIDPANVRSIRLAERLGCVRDHAATAPSEGDFVYRHPTPEALAA